MIFFCCNYGYRFKELNFVGQMFNIGLDLDEEFVCLFHLGSGLVTAGLFSLQAVLLGLIRMLPAMQVYVNTISGDKEKSYANRCQR